MTDYPEGYCPHHNQTKLKCPQCGGDVFACYPQGISTAWKPTPCEFTCVRCQHIVCVLTER